MVTQPASRNVSHNHHILPGKAPGKAFTLRAMGRFPQLHDAENRGFARSVAGSVLARCGLSGRGSLPRGRRGAGSTSRRQRSSDGDVPITGATVGLSGVAREHANNLGSELVGQLGQAADVGDLDLGRRDLGVATQGEVGVAGNGSGAQRTGDA